VTGSTVDVRAERVARAATDSAARDVLSRVVTKEDITPASISIQSERPAFGMGVGYEVHYHVRAPKNTVVRATTTKRAHCPRRCREDDRGDDQWRYQRGRADRWPHRHDDQRRCYVEMATVGARPGRPSHDNGGISLTLPVDSRLIWMPPSRTVASA